MRVVADSSPLISFSILKRLDLLTLIFSEVHVPDAVVGEISVSGKPHFKDLYTFANDKRRSVGNADAVKLLTNEVDLGEAEVIILALELGIADVLIDDAKGRSTAQARGLHPIGTIGVLLQAKKQGHVAEVMPYLKQLISNKIRIGKSLYQKALELADESE